jgi:hypothetical protein
MNRAAFSARTAASETSLVATLQCSHHGLVHLVTAGIGVTAQDREEWDYQADQSARQISAGLHLVSTEEQEGFCHFTQRAARDQR